MLKQQILADLKKAVKDLGFPPTDILLSIPQNPAFGDYTTNIALQLAKRKSTKGKHPASPNAKRLALTQKRGESAEEIANEIVKKLGSLRQAQDNFETIKIAGGGFINFFIKSNQLVKNITSLSLLSKSQKLQKIMIEYGHVNPLKEVHIGHLRTFILGESLSRIHEALGNTVFRANYQGDIGLHIAKAIWGIKKKGLPSEKLNLAGKAEFLGQAYAEGNSAYEQDPAIAKEIDQINAALYDHDPQIKEVYGLARSWSLEYFEPIYQLLGVAYDRCFFESEVYEAGKQIVLENLGSGKVFEKNDGAIIFPGEKYGLHNRVFVTSAGHATYEGKEMGLSVLEYDTFNYDKAVHVVASEQAGYFQVVFKAIELIFPNLGGKKYHLSYGVVDLKEGKMSSRSGTVVTVDDLFHVTCEKVREVMKQNRLNIDQEIVKTVALGAIKFSYLKFSPEPNMVFDIEGSVSLVGDSGPYLQYTCARIQSVLRKAKDAKKTAGGGVELGEQERMILRVLLYFSEMVEQAAASYHPNILASYLIELARAYNLFYQGTRIIGSEKEGFRLQLTEEVGKVLQKGLNLLGIEAPERM